MELAWEDSPVPEAPFFTRDFYDKYSLAPNIRELWAFLQSPAESSKQNCGAANTSCSPSTNETAESKDNVRKRESCGSDGADDAAGNKSKLKLKQVDKDEFVPYPEPRLPYPCMSNLSSKDQKTYLGILMGKKTCHPPQSLKERVNNEVMQFMRYLQDVAKICADDYKCISQGAMKYSEEVFTQCLEHIRTFPELYQIHEMTSLTGGTFNPGLNLTFEKQLLIMGNVDITDHEIVPADAQLASDYQSVSSESPPAKKAKDMHAKISGDCNANSLAARYEPHVCLTQAALVRLLDNHGPEFGETWELPVCVKLNTVKGSSLKKTVYIDSPLLKTEMTVRERSHIYHEESLKLSIKKHGRKNVFHVMTELQEDEKQPSPVTSQRNVVSSENNGLDFEVDLTDLETFGETTPAKVPKMQTEKAATIKAPSSLPLAKPEKSSEHHVNTSGSSQEEMNTSSTDADDAEKEEPERQVVNKVVTPKTEQKRLDAAQDSGEDVPFMGDSDEEKLVIDDLSPTQRPPTKHKSLTHSVDPLIPDPESVSVKSQSPSPQKVTKQRRSSKKAKTSGDQLGDILRMQSAMFNSANDTPKCSTMSQETNPPTPSMGHSVHPHAVSLVKPCVSSYLERNQDLETCAAPHTSAPVVSVCPTEHKKILSEDLQAGAEDEQDYKAPEEGNLLYKLYSLQDLLLMVRSSVSLTHTRKVGKKSQNQCVPVYVLPKLEYQLSYGVECLSSSEACELWTEALLHSSAVPYIAHINALTSKVALLRKLPDDWKQNISCGFKPSKSLNILHHLLKKLTGLEEGQYLITHKAGEPFVTLLKASNGKVSRGAYNLQQVHSSVPQPPASVHVPWIPVDPYVVLPFHQKHDRVPCTFPPKPFTQTAKDGSPQCNNHRAGQLQNNANVGRHTKRNQKKRAARRNKYIKNLIQKSI